MSNDIKLAELENFLEAKRHGLLEVIDGTMQSIRAHIVDVLGPPAVDDLPWRYDVPDAVWRGLMRGECRSIVVSLSARWLPQDVPPKGAVAHVYSDTAPSAVGPFIGTVSLVAYVAGHPLLRLVCFK